MGKKYMVQMTAKVRKSFEVEADNINDATDIAWKLWDETKVSELTRVDAEVGDIYEVGD